MKRLQRLGLLLGPLMVALLLANMIAGISPVEAARKSTQGIVKTAAVCPTDATAITSMSVKITRGGNVLNRSNLATVLPGDIVKVTFDLNDACSNYRVSLVSYKAPDTTNNLDSLSLRVVSSSQSLTFGASGGSLTVTVPNCYNATIFAVGAVLTSMGPSSVYGSRQKDTVNSGTSACSGIGSPTPTFYSGTTQTCSSLDNNYGETWAEYNISGLPTNGTRTLASGGYTATISGFNGSNTFSWSSAGTSLKAVVVKSAGGANLYRYASGSFGASNLKSVGMANGSMYTISSVLLCYLPIPTTAVCPTDKTAVTSYRFEIWRGSTKINATDLNNVQQGDLVKAFFDLAPGCTNVRISFAGYEAKENYYNIDSVSQQIYKVYVAVPGDTGLYSATQPASERMVQTIAPNCNFQVDFVFGAIIENLTPSNLYGERKYAWKNGGTNLCAWAITPTSTPTPNGTQTAVANQTATSVAKTATNIAGQTATSVAKTATNVAGQTATSVAKTATNVAGQTATSVAATATKIANQTATAVVKTQTAAATQTQVAATTTAVAGATQTAAATQTQIAKTSTAIANQTATSAAATTTAQPAATQTAIAKVTQTASAGGTQTAVAGGTQTAIAGATQTAAASQTQVAQTSTAVAGVTETHVAEVTETAAEHETETAIVNQTGTAIANQTGTAIAGVTETAGAHETETAVAATETEWAHETETAMAAATDTPTATATPAPGQLRIHKTDENGSLLYGACFEIYSVSANYEASLCDDEAGDSNDVNGEIWIDGLLAANDYIIYETLAPENYVGVEGPQGPVVVPAGGFGEITIMNTLDTTPTGTIINIHKLNCETMPGSINPIQIALGNLPAGCVFAPSGVTFTIEQLTNAGATVQTVVLETTNGHVETFTVGVTVSDLRVTEHAATNPFWMAPTNPIFFDEVQCACGHSDLVVVNLPDPANPTPTNTPVATNTPEPEPTATETPTEEP